MRKTFKFDKLIRDKLYKKMVDAGIEVQLKEVCDEQVLLNHFKAKMLEEASEVSNADSESELIEELADCLEVIHGFSKMLNVSFEKIDQIRKEKAEEKGGFSNVVVDSVSFEPTEKLKRFYEYYLKNSNRYPEV